MAKEGTQNQVANDPDADKFPTFKEVASRLADDDRFADLRVRHLDIRFGANGDGFYRVWEGRNEDWQAGVLPAAD